MKHFVVFPSAITARANACIESWAVMGYLTLVFQDEGAVKCDAHVVRSGRFLGYYRVINGLVEDAFNEGADVVTCIGDDMFPDKSIKAETHARMYFEQFPHGDGVMQSTGDRQGIDSSGKPASERICGSPTFGRDWAIRGYMGRGPFHDGYSNYYADEDLYNVAKNHALLYQEPRINIIHKHWSWGHTPRQSYHVRNSDTTWNKDAALFRERQTAGFPDSGLMML